MFETVISTIEHFAKDIEDFPTAKMSLLALSRMCSLWGGPDVVQMGTPQNGATPSTPALPGFSNFMMSRFSPLCWALPTTQSFNPKDAQAKQVLAEAAGLQRTIYSKAGPEYIEWLRDRELPGLGMTGNLIEEYLNALQTLDVKGFRQFFQVCYGGLFFFFFCPYLVSEGFKN